MKKKALIILISLGLFTVAGSGAAAWWWYMNQPEQMMARAQQFLADSRGAESVELLEIGRAHV